MQIKSYEEITQSDYEKYVRSYDDSMIYLSSIYKKMLENILEADSRYLIAVENEDIVGILPTFIKRSKKYGNVINSLPFYGSNGGFLASSKEAKQELLKAYNELVKEEKCVSGTIITSPFEKDNDWYKENVEYTYIDNRIGQVTVYPENFEKNEANLMDLFHYKTRNSIRKAEKCALTVYKKNDEEAWDYLYKTHVISMEHIGGIAKKSHFFEYVKNIFKENKDYCIYVAEYDNEIIAACLLFYYNTTVEYFVPVTTEGYRNMQPLSKIIYEAMKDSIHAGYNRWNWGGTWITQEGVYNFKKKWGTEDYPYYYYNKIYDKKILEIEKQELLEEFEYFYVIPFSVLG
ncbi:peptidoglycan bridge formation glycyltransferase FemA/FemB family protein [Lachnospiraceae bacterium MD335]|nr:peptidoglycan bridge formation glycyltransferase FemA/FemB family protein [Lachnospiraceae bacterium MD335]